MEPPRRPAIRSPVPLSPTDRERSSSKQSQRPGSSDSGSSLASNITSLSVSKRPYPQPLPSYASHKNASTTSLNTSRPSAPYMSEGTRKSSGLSPLGHRRQHSQGFFEPSVPSISAQTNMQDHSAGLSASASRIAAQAAMQHLNSHNLNALHVRRRSSTLPPSQDSSDDGRRSSNGSIESNIKPTLAAGPENQYRNGLVGTTAAATAASAVFPKVVVQQEEKETKKGGLRRFRPKNIGIIRDKDKDQKEKPIPSPNKLPTSGLSQVVNASSASLAETLSSNNSSFYSLNNGSTSTIIPANQDKERNQKHHGLRQKLKLKDKDDHHALPLSSANSNSRPVDLNNPQSLYSFAPSSPNHTSTFAKTVSGLDLRHGGRALREKRREEKALETATSRGDSETSEWPSMHGLGTTLSNTSTPGLTPYSTEMRETLASFGLHNMTPDDAWDLLKAKLLIVFEGEDVRIAVEDLNRLVSIHIQRCVMRKEPSIIIGDLEDLLKTGFLSLNHTLRSVPDEKLVSSLVAMWMSVFGTILPFIQAVFLPLDQEFKGRGTVLATPKMAAEFWGALPHAETGSQLASSPASGESAEIDVAAGEELEVRRILLISFRDIIILPKYEVLKATFSRLSLESINVSLTHLESTGRNRGNSGSSDRPTTAVTLDPTFSSYSSQTSTLLGTLSSGARSRATSNLSSGSNPAQEVAFQSFSSPPAARPSDSSSAQVTETVGRMLQCLSVLCSVQTGDEVQSKMEDLNKHLKLNWLGRGRTGRNRKGFVGSRVRPLRSVASTIRADRDGSPTPTPTRQGTVSRQGDDFSRNDRALS